MSLSIDDLTSSLSSSHIGQEANDLAALHAQLAQAFFGQQAIVQQATNAKRIPRSNPQNTQPCNTPTQTSNFTISDAMEGTHYQLATSWRSEDGFQSRKDDMDEDERMVEDLLIPSSPASPPMQTPLYSGQFDFGHTQIDQSMSDNLTNSSFATTDPFFLAQCQALEKPAQSHSFFSQLGRPVQQSPFLSQGSAIAQPLAMAPHASPMEAHSYHHHLFATTTTFNG
jgi:hypothetical protein